MDIFEIILIAISLAMDAFSVSVCKGITFNNKIIKKAFIVSLYFSFFQFLMPIFGFILGNSFSFIIKSLDHWISFILLFIIGFQMIIDNDTPNNISDSISIFDMFLLSMATSIDALTVGITFSFYDIPLIFYSFIIGIITFILCFIGCVLGNKIGNKRSFISNYIGGFTLIIIAFKILLEHLHLFTLI